MFDLGPPSVFRKILLKDKTIEEFRRHHELLKLLYPLRVSKRMTVVHLAYVLPFGSSDAYLCFISVLF